MLITKIICNIIIIKKNIIVHLILAGRFFIQCVFRMPRLFLWLLKITKKGHWHCGIVHGSPNGVDR